MSETTTAPLRFGPDYLEHIEHVDGPQRTHMVLRLIRPTDVDRLREGFARLSPDSRYRRFFAARSRLTDAELRYLTEVDGIDHFALALGLLDENGEEGDGVGIARFVRLADDPTIAEPALAVVDAMQGRGLGRLLLLRLIAAASERGITKFRSEFLATNTTIRELVEDVADEVEFSGNGSVVTATMVLPHVAPDHPNGEPGPDSSAAQWLGLAAARAVQLRHRLKTGPG
jgi:GNAT superfamily N-acetyltransferase